MATAVSSSAPAPFNFPMTAAALANPRPTKLSRDQRDAIADLTSIVRSVRFDLASRPIEDGAMRFTPKYLQEVGKQVLEVINSNYDMQARDWDAVIDLIRLRA